MDQNMWQVIYESVRSPLYYMDKGFEIRIKDC